MLSICISGRWGQVSVSHVRRSPKKVMNSPPMKMTTSSEISLAQAKIPVRLPSSIGIDLQRLLHGIDWIALDPQL